MWRVAVCFYHRRALSIAESCKLPTSALVTYLAGLADNASTPLNFFLSFLQVDLQRKLEERNRLLGEYKVRMCISLEIIST